MDEAFNDKAEQFERLWDGITPKGINRNKSLKFRQYILEHVRPVSYTHLTLPTKA